LDDDYSVTKMCLWLGVSRSGFYKWRRRKDSARSMQRQTVKKSLVINFKRFRQRYGSPRLTIELNAQGIQCCRNHVAELMREEGLRARNGKRFTYRKYSSSHNQVSDNKLQRQFDVDRPNQKWVSDITYIKVKRGYVYLAVIMDLFSRRIIGWAMDETMTSQLVIDAYRMAIAKRNVQPGLILHSDRGVQYRSGDYQRALLNNDVISSMSRSGNCWDNAAMESFFARLKVESVHAESFKGIDDAYTSVFEYIEVFYNRVRRHSANEYKSPASFEENYYAKSA